VVRFIRESVKKSQAEEPWLTGAITVDILDGRLRTTPFYWLAIDDSLTIGQWWPVLFESHTWGFQDVPYAVTFIALNMQAASPPSEYIWPNYKAGGIAVSHLYACRSCMRLRRTNDNCAPRPGAGNWKLCTCHFCLCVCFQTCQIRVNLRKSTRNPCYLLTAYRLICGDCCAPNFRPKAFSWTV